MSCWKNISFSFGKYDVLMVTPQRNLPVSGSSSPVRILNKAVFGTPLLPTKAILSPLWAVRLKSRSSSTSPADLQSPSISRITSPLGRPGLNTMNGYFLDEAGRSSMFSFSRSFFLEVACLALEALDEKRWMNSFNSLALVVSFRFWSCFCFKLSWLAWYQKS